MSLEVKYKMDLLILFLILLIIFIIIFFLFIYTAQKDLNLRSTHPGYKATTYNSKNIKEGFKYDSLPLLSKNPLNDIFLSLVFPAYNEEKRLSPALEKAVNYFSSLNIKYEIIIVNDGSRDKTLDLIKNEIIMIHEALKIAQTFQNNDETRLERAKQEEIRNQNLMRNNQEQKNEIQ